jgi:hypothetical protein
MAKEKAQGDDYYQDYMMVLEVFDKIDPAEQGNNSGFDGSQQQQQQQGGNPFDLGGNSTYAGDISSIGGVSLGGYGGEVNQQQQGTTAGGGGRAKRVGGGVVSNVLDMDNGLDSLAGDGFGHHQYLDQSTGLAMNTHLLPTGPAGGSTTTKKRGAGTVDDLLSHVALAKQRRRERNKVLARKTRVKKKVELEQLKNTIDHLTLENNRLRSLVASAGVDPSMMSSLNSNNNAGSLDDMMAGIANDNTLFASVNSGTLKNASAGLAEYPPIPGSGRHHDGTNSDSVSSNNSKQLDEGNSINGSGSDGAASLMGGDANANSDNQSSDNEIDDDKTSGEMEEDDNSNNNTNTNTNAKDSGKDGSGTGRVTRTSARRGAPSEKMQQQLRDIDAANRTRNGGARSSSSSAAATAAAMVDHKKKTPLAVAAMVSEIIDVDSADTQTVLKSFSTTSAGPAGGDETDESEDHVIRCVVVEDSLVQAKIMCNHLLSLKSEERVMKVYRVSSAEGAVDLLNKKGGCNADLWFIDQNLGATDDAMKGSDLIYQIRSKPESSIATVVGVTTNPVAHFAEMNAAGVDIVWGKDDINGKGMTNKLSRLISPRNNSNSSNNNGVRA